MVDVLMKKELSGQKAAEKFDFPKSTISRKVNNKNMGSYGCPPTLSSADKSCLVEGLKVAANWGFF